MQRLLFVLPLILLVMENGVAEEKQPVQIETDHGAIRWKEAPGEPDTGMARIVRDLTAEEKKKLDTDAEYAKELIKKYVPESERSGELLEDLDLAFAGWLRSTSTKKETKQKIISVMGAAYGRYCITHLGLRWAIARDNQGTAIALVRDDPEIISFPFSSIEYRIEDKKTDFIYALYAVLKHLIEKEKK